MHSERRAASSRITGVRGAARSRATRCRPGCAGAHPADELAREGRRGPPAMSSFPDPLHALLYPRAYPHGVRAVDLIETHISWVLLTGSFAYKIKRPVRYAFIDLRSPQQRRSLCHEEVRLNRRFAPELYLGVRAIRRRKGEARIGGAGPVIEHAVRMREFPH